MNERPDQDAETTGSERNDLAQGAPDSKGPVVMLAMFVVLLGAVIVLGILTKP